MADRLDETDRLTAREGGGIEKGGGREREREKGRGRDGGERERERYKPIHTGSLNGQECVQVSDWLSKRTCYHSYEKIDND